MRFLIDRCAGTFIAEWLRTQGHDVVESRERGPDPGDRVLLEWAAQESRILINDRIYFAAFRCSAIKMSFASKVMDHVRFGFAAGW